MNPSQPPEGWQQSPSQGPSSIQRSIDQSQRPLGQQQYGSSTPTHRQNSQPGPVLPPPGGPIYGASPQNGPNLPAISGMTQPPPGLNQHHHSMPHSEQASSSHSQPIHQQQPHNFSSMNQTPSNTMQSQSNYEQDRQMHEARDREQYEQSRREQQREQDTRDGDLRDRQQLTPQSQSNEPFQLHQPVAMRTGIHGPNGLLNSGQSTNPPATSAPISAGVSLFAPPPYDRQQQQQPQPQPPQQQQNQQVTGAPQSQVSVQNVLPFSGTPGMHQMSSGGPGQQPILNDALTYLDQVKVQFTGEPNVYNQFLDIMKDFKSQNIDTPGVIRRVSSLFAGNPSLIQGFNTFLPPGYKIECGIDGDENAIRVTTPMGSTVSPMGTNLPPRNNAQVDDLDGTGFASGGHDNNVAWASNRGNDQDVLFSPSHRAHGLNQQGANSINPPLSPFDPSTGHQYSQKTMNNNQAVVGHSEDQQRLRQLQNTASAAAADNIQRQAESSTPTGPPNGISAQGATSGERKGPVEFNHAISYVNKIKNRFSSQPEIYKQFLEILQTYQRESKPIQDVYAQVTVLFNGAPDLLEDFKQFLPDHAAAKEAAIRQAAEEAMNATTTVRERSTLHQTPRAEGHRMPPMGNFAPTPSASRDGKRKRGDRHGNSILPGGAPDFASVANSKSGHSHKRGKQPNQVATGVKYTAQPEVPPLSPTLVPALPTPMMPNSTGAASADELAIFDRVKKAVGNKNTFNEFLKLCNYFAQDYIDKNHLVYRVQSFIGSNTELFNAFKTFVGYDGKDHILENAARPLSGRVNLNNCRSLGQSYREMPKRERMKPCSGRDDLCKEVLNDQWVSHPTWASEEAGFLAHKKNTYEEALHKIEEERHDYDQHVATAERVIQVLQPLVERCANMTQSERDQWKLDPYFAGQATPIYRKIIAKIYSREMAPKIADNVSEHPGDALPIVMMRIRQRKDEWRSAQKEWEKVWREQTQKIFWKSLDHQGIMARGNDKRQFQAKTLTTEIQVKFEEQRAQRLAGLKDVPSVQASYFFNDEGVLMDGAKLVLTYAEQNHATDMPRLLPFIKEFVPLFFGLDANTFQERIDADFEITPATEEDGDIEMQDTEEPASTRGRKLNGKNKGLIRDVFRSRSGKPNHNGDKENGSGTASRASTPDIASTTGGDEDMSGTGDDGNSLDEPKPKTWIDHSESGNIFKTKDIKPNEPFKRDVYNLYANAAIYCFFRLLCILFERLEKIKQNEAQVHETVKRAKAPKAALELKMIDRQPETFFNDTSSNANYYKQILLVLEEFAKGEGEMSNIEEVLRRYYLQNGWMLYSFDKMLGAVARFAISILSTESKDKSNDIINLFQKDRKKEMTTHADELAYRKAVETRVKEGDIYRIAFNQQTKNATIRILKRDDSTFPEGIEDGLTDPKDRWRQYVASYVQPSTTEGVIPSELRRVFVPRQVSKAKRSYDEAFATDSPTSYNSYNTIQPTNGTDDQHAAPNGNNNDETTSVPGPSESKKDKPSRLDVIASSENLQMRISTVNYRMLFNVPPDPAVIKEREGGRKQFWPTPEVRDEEWWLAVPHAPPAKRLKTGEEDAQGETDTAVAPTADESIAAANAPDETTTNNTAAEPPTTNPTSNNNAEDAPSEPDDADTPEHALKSRFVMNNSWMRGVSREEVDEKNGNFRVWKDGDGAAVEGT